MALSQSAPTDEDRGRLLDTTAKLHGLEIAPEWRAEVLFHMRVLGEAAQLLAEFPLGDRVEPAPVFGA